MTGSLTSSRNVVTFSIILTLALLGAVQAEGLCRTLGVADWAQPASWTGAGSGVGITATIDTGANLRAV